MLRKSFQRTVEQIENASDKDLNLIFSIHNKLMKCEMISAVTFGGY